MKALLKFIILIFLSYSVYGCSLFLLQREMMFPRWRIKTPPEIQKMLPGVEKIWLETRHGKIETWFLAPSGEHDREKPGPAAIFAHGNAELIDFWEDEFRLLARLGIGVLLVEYPGYGRSEGKPSQAVVTEIFTMAYDLLASRKDVDPSRIILIGRSIGGGVICQLAAKRPSAALILMSTFTSLKSFVRKYFLPAFLLRDTFDSETAVRAYPGPILVIHGTDDETVPYEHGLKLRDAGKHVKMITYNGAGHNNCPPDWNAFWREAEIFLRDAGVIRVSSAPF
ncbi:MAG: hypothetical protein BWK80_44555 [Desulfobacteraceae bacterium IS3]|nr:MAG: hypothetical protein BWK80_44555 [Desulfobacteraceae bacterium IS3]